MSHEIEERNRNAVEALFAATGAGDWATAESMLTEDFFVTEAPGNPFAGVYRGRRALRDLYSHVVPAAGVTGLNVKQYAAGGDYVVALVDMVLEGTPPVHVELAEVFRFKDGKLCEIRPHYFDAEPLAAAVAARQRRTP